MKTKNIFRVLLTAVFVLGTMAMNAQTKVYVHTTNGSDGFDIANVDSISFNPVYIQAGDNLLINPGFEDPADGTSGMPTPWKSMSLDELLQDAAAAPSAVLSNRITPDDAFWSTNPTCLPVHGGGYAGRLQASSSAGLYQLVNITPGKTYTFKAYVLNFKTNVGTQTVRTEYLRIKSEDGAQVLGSAAIGTDENTWVLVTGTVTIPSDYTSTSSQIRFQVSHYDAAGSGNRGPATLVDDCEFAEVQ